jgi:predicted nucleic acid-binding protein
MRAYLDSSVVLRVVLGEQGRLSQWSRLSDPVSSEITRVECLRVLDRLRLAAGMDDRELARRRASPFPTQLRTLDALHLASALLMWGRYPELRFATHDSDLGLAAAAQGLHIIGL